LKIGSVDQKLFKFQLTRVWELLTTPGTERDIAFSQLTVKGLKFCVIIIIIIVIIIVIIIIIIIIVIIIVIIISPSANQTVTQSGNC
jgi:hypothetical protein